MNPVHVLLSFKVLAALLLLSVSDLSADTIRLSNYEDTLVTGVTLGISERFDNTKEKRYGIRGVVLSADQFLNHIMSGTEDIPKTQVAAEEQMKVDEQKRLLGRYMLANAGIGKVPSQEDYDAIRDLSNEDVLGAVNNYPLLLEKLYAEKAFTSAVTNNEFSQIRDDGWVPDELNHWLLDFSSDLITRREGLQYLEKKAEAKWKDLSLDGKAKSYAMMFVPLATWWNTTDVVDKEKYQAGDLLVGNNISEQVQYLWNLPSDEMMSTTEGAFNKIFETSPTDAFHFLRSVQSYGHTDELLDNVFGILDFASVVLLFLITLHIYWKPITRFYLEVMSIFLRCIGKLRMGALYLQKLCSLVCSKVKRLLHSIVRIRFFSIHIHIHQKQPKD